MVAALNERKAPAADRPAGAASVQAKDVKAWLDAGQAVLVDVREPSEHAREHIAGAILAPLSRLDAAALSATAGKRVVLHCASGMRSADAAKRLQALGLNDIEQLAGGIEAWKRAGYPVAVDPRAPLPIMRQVQIVAGSLALLGVVLGFAVHPGFFLLSGCVGAGLLMAGVTGTCMMANLLLKLPYNRPQRG